MASSLPAENNHFIYSLSLSQNLVSSTGEALQYINEVIYDRWDKRREHFAILITEGRSTDEYLEISKTIRRRGIDVSRIAYFNNATRTYFDLSAV